MTDLPSRYNPQETEDKWCKIWEDRHLFHAEVNPDKKPFTVVIPPPNVTGILHMGHALNNTLQDILVRYKRMKGFETLWMPGTDHAGIATQNVVEKQLAREGKKRQDIGREEFLKKLWNWQKQYGGTILHQLKKLGSSCDWDRTRFTMDEEYSEAVKLIFVKLFEKGLIYRGERIINWCPRCQSALSDEEAEHKEVKGALYHIRYPFKDNPNQSVVVATTRPETMLGDTAVAVNPKDSRYKKLVGKTLVLPLVNREIKIIADDFVDPKFGSGAVKVTPAHDPNDFAMGKRHNLPFINILHPDGRLNAQAGRFAELDRFIARKKIVEELKEYGNLEKVEECTHAVGHCYRCDTVVEPYLSKQWFVKMKPLARPAIAVVKKGKIKFTPKRWTKVYLNWMENIQDWCISRQIWWGHRIPVWYCVGDTVCHLKCQEPIVSRTPPRQCPHCGSRNLKQDEDVLDTWFSSWLWPFATLNWPKNKKELEYFYPTSTLFTASEIIFFWVARMIMAGLEFMGDIPFSEVYIHGTVRDAKGQKMSKSLGNAIDPLEIIKEYGTDALRFSLIINSGQDIFISKEKFEIGRNFANKIWNASRLILSFPNASVGNPTGPPTKTFGGDNSRINLKELDFYSCWILSRLNSTLAEVSRSIEKYRFSEAETFIYEFFWGNFCDWYLEIIKDKLSDSAVRSVALSVLEKTLRMIHPFMPFVTEEIYSKIRAAEGRPLSQESWPKTQKKFIDPAVEQEMKTLIELISTIRNLQIQWNIAAGRTSNIIFVCLEKDDIAFIERHSAVIQKFARIDSLTIDSKLTKLKDAASAVVGRIKFFIPLEGLIDIPKEKTRLSNELSQHTTALESLSGRLNNPSFLEKAPAEVIEKEKTRLSSLTAKVEELRKIIQELN